MHLNAMVVRAGSIGSPSSKSLSVDNEPSWFRQSDPQLWPWLQAWDLMTFGMYIWLRHHYRVQGSLQNFASEGADVYFGEWRGGLLITLPPHFLCVGGHCLLSNDHHLHFLLCKGRKMLCSLTKIWNFQLLDYSFEASFLLCKAC